MSPPDDPQQNQFNTDTAESLGRIEQKLNGVRDDLKRISKDQQDHEIRIRSLESMKAKLAGIAVGSAAVISLVFKYLSSVFHQ